jgi:hypothetical protein
MINTGAVKGKMLNTIQTGLVGKNISKERNQNGATMNNEYIEERLCAS